MYIIALSTLAGRAGPVGKRAGGKKRETPPREGSDSGKKKTKTTDASVTSGGAFTLKGGRPNNQRVKSESNGKKLKREDARKGFCEGSEGLQSALLWLRAVWFVSIRGA